MLTAAYDALDAAADGMHVKEYEIDTSEGRQEVIQVRPGEIDQHIDWLERKIQHLEQRLNGIGVCNLTMKRKY